MKLKWVLAGAVVLTISIVAVLIAGRDAPAPDRSSEHYQLVISSDNKLILEPGKRPKMTVTLESNASAPSAP